MNDNEGIKGCYNRINAAINQEDKGDLYIAMEGILYPNKYGTFLCRWTVIYNKSENEYYYGCSAKVKVPDKIISSTTKDERLSNVVANYYGSNDEEISKLGINSLLTYGTYTRIDEFTDSIKCSISSKYKKIKIRILL